MNKTKNAESKGITLIALIITIIIMLILVTVSITMAVKGGLFNYAGKATKETQNAITAEQMLAEGKIQIGDFFYNSYQDYLDGIYSENQPNAPIQLTYKLSSTEPTKMLNIDLKVSIKDYMDYNTWGQAILDDLEDKIKDEAKLKEAKEALLLEGINYLDVERGYWSGEGFDTLQEFVDWANKEWDTDYENIYEFMENEYKAGETDNETINMFMLGYGDMYIKPKEYMAKFGGCVEITKPDGEIEEVANEGNFAYLVSKNGNYTFIAQNGNGDKGAISIKVRNITIEEKFSSIYKETTEYKENGKTVAWIPKGFAVGVESVNTVINKVSEGLVITDKVDSEGHSIGNEFVWVPVEEGKFNRTEWTSNFPKETISAGYTEEVPQDLIDSVEEYGGFYIGRYEAGLDNPRTSDSTPYPGVKVQNGLYPYNYIPWENSSTHTGAVTVSEELYEESDSVVSTLCYGVEWDSVLRFIRDKFNISDSTSWGNHKKENGERKLLQTGICEQNKAKNIYDLAGNVWEWTMEKNGSSCRVLRGGGFDDYGGFFPAASRVGHDPSGYYNYLGFRVSLYVK